MSAGDLSDRDRRILASIARGAHTPADFARIYGTRRTAMALALARLHRLGRVEPSPGEPPATVTRPYPRYQLSAA